MTVEEYWKMYTRCPKCKYYYLFQPIHRCHTCIYLHPYMDPNTSWDRFVPTEECMQHMNRVIDGKKDVNL